MFVDGDHASITVTAHIYPSALMVKHESYVFIQALTPDDLSHKTSQLTKKGFVIVWSNNNPRTEK